MVVRSLGEEALMKAMLWVGAPAALGIVVGVLQGGAAEALAGEAAATSARSVAANACRVGRM